MGGDYYDETLSLEPGHVRTGRLDDGGPVLNSHQSGNVDHLVGSVVPGSVRLADGSGFARIQLAQTPGTQETIAKIKGGHLRKVSVGYQVYEFERIEHPGQRDELRAVDWEPIEISLVAVPADPGAKIRSKENVMPPRPDRNMGEAIPEFPMTAERTAILAAGGGVTASFIRQQCAMAGLDQDATMNLIEAYTDEPGATRAEFLEGLIARGAAQAQYPQYAAAARGGSAAPIDGNHYGHRSGGNGGNQLLERMQGALYAKIANKPPAPESREFMGASLIDMARGLLNQSGVRAGWLAPHQVFERFGAQSTSDFTNLMNGAVNQYLTEQYAIAPSPLMALARSREVRDFREIRALTVTGAPELLTVLELEEYKYASLTESTASYRVLTFGRILALSRQLIINDNLGAFVEASNWYVRSAAKTRANIFVALIQGNPLLGDGEALFSATHGNLGAGADINMISLSAARQAMRGQKDADGDTLLGVTPKYLVVGPAKETEAEQALAVINAAVTSDANPFSGKLELIVEPRLLGNAWYLFADPDTTPVLERATLIGQGDTVFTDTRMGFHVDGVETKARIDFGAGIVDYRGAYKNPGL